MRRPRWFAANVRMFIRRRSERRRALPDPAGRADLLELPEAVIRVLDVAPEAFWAADRALPGRVTETPSGMEWDARPTLQRLINAVVRLRRPDVMVETGVARGLSSAVALQAMEDAGRGRLYSVDMPALAVAERFVGSAVPAYLRHRWELALGPSEAVLPALLDRLGEIDVFVHDADHTYRSQMEEYRAAWRHLRPGGLLLSDDVVNGAFDDFALEIGGEPVLIRPSDASVPGALGLMGKPGNA